MITIVEILTTTAVMLALLIFVLMLMTLLLLMMLLGPRGGELRSLTWDDADAGVVRFRDTKNGTTHELTLPNDAIEILSAEPRVEELAVFAEDLSPDEDVEIEVIEPVADDSETPLESPNVPNVEVTHVLAEPAEPRLWPRRNWAAILS